LVVLAVGCAVSLRSWPLFVQRRVGRNGRQFAFPKLRTLPKSAPVAVDKYALNGTPIPRFCRFLRRTHLDELPQLLLVPIGVMSLVGPRPEMTALLPRYTAEFVHARTRVRPGCTGLWQLSAASNRLIYEAPEYDLAYLDGSGGLLDLWILYRTVCSWLPGASPVDLDDVPDWAWGRGVPHPSPRQELDTGTRLRRTPSWPLPATVEPSRLAESADHH
jgi:lipopolysaccharide/colanic/teichoic acid biosynthesis glycosyltransferase